MKKKFEFNNNIGMLNKKNNMYNIVYCKYIIKRNYSKYTNNQS